MTQKAIAISASEFLAIVKVINLDRSYLSTVVKSKTAKTVNNWIAVKVIAESQAMLSRSPVSIQ